MPGGAKAGGVDTNDIFERIRKKAEKNVRSDGPVMKCLKFAIHPENYLRLKWDLLVFALVLYSSVAEPYRASFGLTDKDWEVVIDAIFYADLVLNFFTGFDKGYEVVMEKSEIVQNYLSSWFVVDLLATVQWAFAFEWMGFDSESSFIAMMRLLKVLRLARASRLIEKLTAKWTTHTGYIEAFKFFMYVGVVAHILACFFYLWPALWQCEEQLELTAAGQPFYPGTCIQGSWRQSYGLDNVVDGQGLGVIGSNAQCLGGTDEVPEVAATCVGSGSQITCELNENSTACSLGEERCDVTSGTEAEEATAKTTCTLTPVNSAAAQQGSCAVAMGRGKCEYYSVAGSSPICDFTPRIEAVDAVVCELDFSKVSEVDQPLDGSCSNFDARGCSCTAASIANGCTYVPAWPSKRKYTDALYWSITTMTTIGYGDRGPGSNMGEIMFVMFCEVFGLCFFALLLESVNGVNNVMGEASTTSNDAKNGIVQFLRTHNMSAELVDESVSYINFYFSSLSGNSFSEDDDRFKTLSPALQDKIKVALYKDTLKAVRLFGWNDLDKEEDSMVERLFHDIDTDKGGSLDFQEVQVLLKTCGLDVSKKESQACFTEMDMDHMGEQRPSEEVTISLNEFKRWWFMKKNGRPPMVQCPEEFLHAVATRMISQAYAKDERFVDAGEYGTDLIILITGDVRVLRGNCNACQCASPFPSTCNCGMRDASKDQIVTHKDREPAIGISATLKVAAFNAIAFSDRSVTADWAVETLAYSDTTAICREDLQECFDEVWPDGQDHMHEVSRHHYDAHDALGTDDEDDEEDSHLLRVVDNACEVLFTRVNEIESNFENKLDQLLETLKAKQA